MTFEKVMETAYCILGPKGWSKGKGDRLVKYDENGVVVKSLCPYYFLKTGREEPWSITLEEVQSIISELNNWLHNGCGDGSCQIKKPNGMHTNGGCHCDPYSFNEKIYNLYNLLKQYKQYDKWEKRRASEN